MGLATVHHCCTPYRSARRTTVFTSMAMVIAGRRAGISGLYCAVHHVAQVDAMAASSSFRSHTRSSHYPVTEPDHERHGRGNQRRSRIPGLHARSAGAPLRPRNGHCRHQYCFRPRALEPRHILTSDSLRHWVGRTLWIADLPERLHRTGDSLTQQRGCPGVRCRLEVPAKNTRTSGVGERAR